MYTTQDDVLTFVQENDVKFVRLSFCDLFGAQKNISIMADELPAAFEEGVSFDGHAIRGFNVSSRSDLLLFPDPATLAVLPWRPRPGLVARFYCDIKNPDGSTFPLDGRAVLKRVAEEGEAQGYRCKAGAECEFYLFKTDEQGEPTDIPFDKGGYLDMSPLDKGEDIRREICLALEAMGVQPESSHHEQGPGQNEVVFRFSDVLECADNILTFRSAVKAIAARNGLYASFMPKPLAHAAGSGMHVNLSLASAGQVLHEHPDKTYLAAAEHFIAGILNKVPEMTLFLNPLANSYERFGEFEAPRYVSWSHQNRSQLIRIPAAANDRVRMELRSPDPSLNPYLALALIIAAGMEGIEHAAALPPAIDKDLFTADENVTGALELLPDSLEEAITRARSSAFVQRVVGSEVLSKYLEIKEPEANMFAVAAHKTRLYREHYFDVI